jgi:type I restriction enzyme S subunit
MSSRLEKLIEELCPDGVEYGTLADIGRICMCKRVFKDQTSSAGEIPFFKIGTFGGIPDSYISRELYDEYREKYSFPKEGDILISASGTIGRTVVYNNEPAYFQDSNIVWIDNDEEKILNDFLLHFYSTNPWVVPTGGTISRLYNDMIRSIVIPLPPLPIQREIVRILDNFTELTAELTAELIARKKQYEYYRDELLTFGEDVPMMKLKDLCEKVSNIRWNDTDAELKYIDLTSVSCETNQIEQTMLINSENAPSRAQQIVEKDDILFATTRPTLMRYCQVTDEYDGQVCSTGYCVLRANQKQVVPRFLFYLVSTGGFHRYVESKQAGASYPSISNRILKDYEVKVPSLDVQNRIVKTIDNFDTLVTDIKTGIPAEIEIRKKQYYYYRDKLLTLSKL